MNNTSIALLSSDINNKIALSLLFDKQGHRLVFVNEGKLSDFPVKQYAELEESDCVLVDANIGLGDTGKTIDRILKLIIHKRLVLLCDSMTAQMMSKRKLPENVLIFEKPILPDELEKLLNEGAKQH